MPMLVSVLLLLIQIYIWIIIARAVVSWFSVDPRNAIVVFLHRLTDPVLEPLRKLLPDFGPVDVSPLIAILILIVLQRALGFLV